MLLAVRISSYGCTWDVWRVLKKLELELRKETKHTAEHVIMNENFIYVRPCVSKEFFTAAQ